MVTESGFRTTARVGLVRSADMMATAQAWPQPTPTSTRQTSLVRAGTSDNLSERESARLGCRVALHSLHLRVAQKISGPLNASKVVHDVEADDLNVRMLWRAGTVWPLRSAPTRPLGLCTAPTAVRQSMTTSGCRTAHSHTPLLRSSQTTQRH